MLQETISQIEQRIQNAGAIKEGQRAELLKLLGTLKSEVSELSKTHSEEAQSIASFTEISTHEATRERINPELLEHSVAGLSSSVEEFEETHPRLVAIVNRLSTMLANMGV